MTNCTRAVQQQLTSAGAFFQEFFVNNFLLLPTVCIHTMAEGCYTLNDLEEQLYFYNSNSVSYRGIVEICAIINLQLR